MPDVSMRRRTGWLFVIAVVAFLVTSSLLSSTFEWPAILRRDAAEVLTNYHAGGATLTWTWFAVAWSYCLLIVPVLMLRSVLEPERDAFRYIAIASTLGAVAVVASLVGFLRWVFVVPGLAEMYFAPGATEATRQAVVAAYHAQHQFGGTLLGEHVSQVLSVAWSLTVSIGMLGSRLFSPLLGWFGIAASVAYLLGQGEILHTAIASVPEVPLAGPLGSSAWGLWVLLLGVSLIRARAEGTSTSAAEQIG